MGILSTLQLSTGEVAAGGNQVTRYHTGSNMGIYDSPFVATGGSFSCSVSGADVVSTGWSEQSSSHNYRSMYAIGQRYATTGDVFSPYDNITFGPMTYSFTRHPHLFML